MCLNTVSGPRWTSLHPPLLPSALLLICSAGLDALPSMLCFICVLAVRWRRWMPAACSWLLSLWPAWTRHCSSMTCVASRCRGNTAVPGASSMANCSRANWPGLPATGPLCWTCVRDRYGVRRWSMFSDDVFICTRLCYSPHPLGVILPTC